MSLSWPGNTLGRAGGSVRGEGSLGVPAQAAAPATRPRISGRKWMDGWIDLDPTSFTSHRQYIPRKVGNPVGFQLGVLFQM